MIRNNKGVSIIILVLVLAGLVGAMLVGINNSLTTFNGQAKNQRMSPALYTSAVDLAQVLYTGYLSGQNPTGCPATYSTIQLGGGNASTFNICLPPNSTICSNQDANYCLKYPYELVEVKSISKNTFVVSNKNFSKKVSGTFIDLFLQKASAATPIVNTPPDPSWMPTLGASGAEPSVQIAAPDCSASYKDCIVCSGPKQNAHCMTFTICLNKSTSCSTDATMIKPTIAFQTKYL